MEIERFFELFLRELEQNKDLWEYYKFHTGSGRMNFRKAYFVQRLRYVYDEIQKNPGKVWDCGCGYGTTALFLAMNGIPCYGTTLEFYIKYLPQRIEYWNQYGDASLFSYSYKNLFEEDYEGVFQNIIVQDTLHHVEPIDQGLKILYNALFSGGKMIVVEENGNNILQRAKLYRQRGNKRIIEIYDERLKKKILLGNENIRSLKDWKVLLERAGFHVLENSLQYIRYFLPQKAERFSNVESLIQKEQSVESKWKKEYFYFGLNFCVQKK